MGQIISAFCVYVLRWLSFERHPLISYSVTALGCSSSNSNDVSRQYLCSVTYSKNEDAFHNVVLGAVVKLLSHRWGSLFLILGIRSDALSFSHIFGQGSIKWKIIND